MTYQVRQHRRRDSHSADRQCEWVLKHPFENRKKTLGEANGLVKVPAATAHFQGLETELDHSQIAPDENRTTVPLRL